MNEVLRGDIWEFDPDPVRGREQGFKIRPALVISSDQVNAGPAELVVVVPLTTRDREIFCHVPILPHEAPVRKKSFAMCEQIRSISKERLIRRWGPVGNPAVLKAVGEWITDLLDL